MSVSRRSFGVGLTALAFSGLGACVRRERVARVSAASPGYGALVTDPAGLLDLPPGFSYRIISRFGETMDDGHLVPDHADGMGCLPLGGARVALVRNHELQARHTSQGPGGTVALGRSYDRDRSGQALPGGTTTLVYDLRTQRVDSQHLSLAGTIRNCAGGTTPWGSWLSCEEDVTRAGPLVGKDHGWIFEVAAHLRELADPVPLRAMGRFNHEGAAVDPRTGIVYLTEDRDDGLFYRFLPEVRGRLAAGGRLQALAIEGLPDGDARNWSALAFTPRSARTARWIDLDGVDSPADDLRVRGHAARATYFARGEGVHFGEDELFFCCTSGGTAKLGQVFRYRPSRAEGRPGERDAPGSLQNFVESTNSAAFNFGDNLTVAPTGHLIVCEDQYTSVVDNHLRGVTPDGALYPLARLRVQTEPAGACFAPDGSVLFINVYSPAQTLAISGPWRSVRSG